MLYIRCCILGASNSFDKARAAPSTIERDINGSITSDVYRNTCGSWIGLWTLVNEGSAEK